MMTPASCSGIARLLRISCLALAWPMLSGQAAPPAPERITFPHENVSDLRGILNVFNMFRHACLEQPVTRDLPQRLVPEGYQVVTPGFHLFGAEGGGFQKAAILSKTGQEESDFAGGYPYIELRMPTDRKPDGECRVVWQRAWDYQDGVTDIMFDTAVLFDSWLSFHVQAIRVSRPDEGFTVADRYGLVSEWVAPCWGAKPCGFDLLLFLHNEDGIHLTMSRDKDAE